MALKEQDIVFTTKDESGNTIIQMPITRVENIEGTFSIEQGGTGATTVEEALKNLRIIEVLADVFQRPNWAMTLGDGSNGAFNPTADTTITGEVYYTSVNIPSGVTVTIDKNAVIYCQGDFVNAGTINGTGTGGAGGAGGTSGPGGNGEAGLTAGGTGSDGKGNSSGGTANTVGGKGIKFDVCDPYAIKTLYGGGGGGGGYGPYNSPSWGGAGGNGGAGLCIVAKNITHTGSIILNGADGKPSGYNWAGGSGGGGGGGSVFFVAESINDTGTFTSNGGLWNTYGYGWGSPTDGENGSKYSYEVMKDVWV